MFSFYTSWREVVCRTAINIVSDMTGCGQPSPSALFLCPSYVPMAKFYYEPHWKEEFVLYCIYSFVNLTWAPGPGTTWYVSYIGEYSYLLFGLGSIGFVSVFCFLVIGIRGEGSVKRVGSREDGEKEKRKKRSVEKEKWNQWGRNFGFKEAEWELYCLCHVKIPDFFRCYVSVAFRFVVVRPSQC